MEKYNFIIANVITANKGTLLVSEALANGVPKHVLYSYIRNNNMVQTAHGVYSVKNVDVDNMFVVSSRSKKVVISHNSALFLHGLIDEEPEVVTVTVNTGYNPSRLKNEYTKVYTVKADLLEEGKIMMETPKGHTVPAYNIERTICDIFRSRASLDQDLFVSAVKRYVNVRNKNIQELLRYGKMFHVENIMQKYFDILM